MVYFLFLALIIAVIVIIALKNECDHIERINSRLMQRCVDCEEQLHHNIKAFKSLQKELEDWKRDVTHVPEYPDLSKAKIQPGWDKRLKDAIEGKE